MRLFLVYMYYTHSYYQTSLFGKNCAYYIRIFMVVWLSPKVLRTFCLITKINLSKKCQKQVLFHSIKHTSSAAY